MCIAWLSLTPTRYVPSICLSLGYLDNLAEFSAVWKTAYLTQTVEAHLLLSSLQFSQLPVLDNPMSKRVRGVLNTVRAARPNFVKVSKSATWQVHCRVYGTLSLLHISFTSFEYCFLLQKGKINDLPCLFSAHPSSSRTNERVCIPSLSL